MYRQSVVLIEAVATDRVRVGRVRPVPESAGFVHYNWFWLNRALADPAIRFRLVRAGPRGGLVGVVAFGPHEAVDGDPKSRIAGIGEVYHLVIDRDRAREGLGAATVTAAIAELRAADPALTAVRIGHNPRNLAAAGLFARLGFRPAGVKADAEDGTPDVLMELRVR